MPREDKAISVWHCAPELARYVDARFKLDPPGKDSFLHIGAAPERSPLTPLFSGKVVVAQLLRLLQKV
jgi:hypothetical protein